MGLLDSLTYDPQMALGMGLLAAGGNSRMPVSVGQGLASGWGQMQDTAKEKQRAALLAQQAEMQKMQMQEVLRKGQESAMRQQQMQSMDVPPEVKAGLVPFDEWWKLQNKPPEFKAFGGGIFNTAKVGPDGAPSKVGDVPLENKPTELDKLMDRAGITDPVKRAQFASQALIKQTTHAPAASAVVKMAPMETEFGKAVGKQQGEEYSSIQKAGFSASGTLNNLSRVESLLDGVNTGKLAPLGKDISSLAASVGINIDPNLPQKEAVAALSNEMALKAKNSGGENMMPGAMSDPDRRFLVEMVPGLSNTKGGNKIIIETLKRKAKRDQQVAKMAREYIGKNKTLDGFSDELSAWSEKNPLFSDLMAQSGGGFKIIGKR